ncbi:MAG TPA: CPBP family intramembrane glutamic endopeptidase [Bacillota bacterium]
MTRHRRSDRALITLLVLALALWLVIFVWQPANFWLLMALGVGVLAALSLRAQPNLLGPSPSGSDVVTGLALAAVLYGLFWLGHRLAVGILPTAPQQIGAIYDLKAGVAPWLIAILLLAVIGPGEEIFWRGFVQRRLSGALGEVGGWLGASLIYAMLHAVTMNLMLVLAALVAGLAWGYAYVRLKRLWPLIISHAAWDVAILLLWPIR